MKEYQSMIQETYSTIKNFEIPNVKNYDALVGYVWLSMSYYLTSLINAVLSFFLSPPLYICKLLVWYDDLTKSQCSIGCWSVLFWINERRSLHVHSCPFMSLTLMTPYTILNVINVFIAKAQELQLTSTLQQHFMSINFTLNVTCSLSSNNCWSLLRQFRQI